MLLSVIIPCYNGQSFISQLIDSILFYNDDFVNRCELILIDDGSTDNTLQIIRQKAEVYPFIQVYEKEHGGIAEARNFGLSIAQGEYVTFCDQDDLCINSWFSFVKAIVAYQADLLIANYRVDREGELEYPSHIKADTICEGPLIKEMVKRCFNITAVFGEKKYSYIPEFYPSIWNCIFKRSMLIENGIQISRFVDYEDDWKLLTDALFSSKIVLLNSGVWYQHSERIGSESHRSKYINNYFEGRKLLRLYYVERLSQISLSEKERIGIMTRFDKETLLSGYANSRQLPFQEYLRTIKGCPYFRRRSVSLLLLAGSIKEFFLIFLLLFRLWRAIWFISSRQTH